MSGHERVTGFQISLHEWDLLQLSVGRMLQHYVYHIETSCLLSSATRRRPMGEDQREKRAAVGLLLARGGLYPLPTQLGDRLKQERRRTPCCRLASEPECL